MASWLELGAGAVALVAVVAIWASERRKMPLPPKPVDVDAVDVSNTGDAHPLGIVGESHYQSNLRAIAGSGEVNHHCIAALLLNDNNPYDSNAVQIQIDARVVGHLSRADAVAYRKHIASKGRIVGGCRAVIRGGGSGRESLGVWLALNPRKKIR